jgi:uncharacterized membrane protein YfcA
MIGFSILHVGIIAAVFVLAGMVKGVTGMGLPTVAMGVLGAIMSPVSAASLLIVPSLVTNLWQLVTGPSLGVLVSRLWPMMLGIVIGTIAGSGLLTKTNTQWTTVALGLTLVAYAGLSLFAPPFSVPTWMERWLALVTGLTTGLMTGGTGVFVIPAVPYLQALNLDKDDLIQALGLSFTVSTVALAIGLQTGGAFEFHSAAGSVLAVVPALLGMELGQRIRHRIRPAMFRQWFLICLALLGLDLIVRPFL